MQVVYYHNRKRKYSPVKKYLEAYSDAANERNVKIIAGIYAKIKFIQDKDGRPQPPTAKPLRGYSFFEILNPKDAKTVIRILFFRHQDKMVLLHAFEKPTREKYTDKEWKEIDSELKIGEVYQQDFISNPNSYEEYEQKY